MDDGFRQEYDTNTTELQAVVMFCRMCRQTFPVKIPGNPQAKVQCMCGHAGMLAEFDVFSSPERAKDFAVFYTNIISAVNDALMGVNPALGGALQSATPVSGSPAIFGDYPKESKVLEHKIEASKHDIVALHDALTEYIELTYRFRIVDTTARKKCFQACADDIGLVADLVEEAKRRRQIGQDVRLTFASFKHLAIMLEEENEFEKALTIAMKAKSLGLRGYDERILRLQKLV